MKYREDECVPDGLDWRDDARDYAQDVAASLGSRRRLTPADVRLLSPTYPHPRPPSQVTKAKVSNAPGC